LPASHAEALRSSPAEREVREPAEVACRIGAIGWRSDRLRLRADAPPFARADRVRSTVVLPVTEQPTEAIAVMDDGRVLLRAVLSLAAVHLYAAKATALSGIVTPAATTDLSWKGSTPDHVRIELGTASVLRAPRPFGAELAC